MSWHECDDPGCEDGETLVIRPKTKDIGAMDVRRALPVAQRRSVGPFVFFDEIGPADLPPGVGVQVRPHPHIGISTITYLFEGEILHRDSLGEKQLIRPGAVNLMTAGRGIVHSERAGDDLARDARLHGIQSWMALPEEEQECDPAFVHHPKSEIPGVEVEGCSVSVIMGAAYGVASPVKEYVPTLYLHCRLPRGNTLELPTDYPELAMYVIDGHVRGGTGDYEGATMVVFPDRSRVKLQAAVDTQCMIIGGAPIGKRIMWWNLVSTSADLIEKAKRDWVEQRFPKVPEDDEYIPLPE